MLKTDLIYLFNPPFITSCLSATSYSIKCLFLAMLIKRFNEFLCITDAIGKIPSIASGYNSGFCQEVLGFGVMIFFGIFPGNQFPLFECHDFKTINHSRHYKSIPNVPIETCLQPINAMKTHSHEGICSFSTYANFFLNIHLTFREIPRCTVH